jgi:hypothetical protein
MFYLSLVSCVARVFVLRGWVRLLLESLNIRVSHSCACMCIVMAIACTCVGSVLYVRASGGFSLDDTSWAISDKVRV